MKTNKTLLAISHMVLTTSLCIAQSLEIAWTFNTHSQVLASVVVDDGMAYVGDEAGVFYAINVESGKEMWRIETAGNIQAKALIVQDQIFFESANIFYLVTKMGEEIWRYDTEMEPLSFTYQGKTTKFKLDFWDDKRSTGTFYDGLIFVGSGNGNLYGLDINNGKVEKLYHSENKSPIRSTPYINDGRLYFGDWEGMVYCYDLQSDHLQWKRRTYRGDRPYPSFGGVVSEFLEYEGMLFFGARNHMMNVLWTETGEKEWTFTDPNGGWMIGDPVLFNDTLYIGGSDNLTMYAFNPSSKPLWSHNGGKNIYTKPAVTEKWLLYTGGNSYNWKDKGMLFQLDRKTGMEVAKLETPNSIFSSPALVGNRLLFGCHDGNIYAVDMKE